ncbi:hypothetical protein Ahy_A03g016392 isoform E [Arachis hypogaea]|uniref:Uncharacterized protein n=1 Tax=Arachis hypogaea TaxID=3818 RepID=A0A445E333_ARAHY|nr:hypothetical protein Ahy_A03g016392 isoform E [Arachis hypogaea]
MERKIHALPFKRLRTLRVMVDSSTSSTSQSNSKKTQPFHFRAKFENQNIQLVANLRNLHQHTIKLSRENKATILKRKWQQETKQKTLSVPHIS